MGWQFLAVVEKRQLDRNAFSSKLVEGILGKTPAVHCPAPFCTATVASVPKVHTALHTREMPNQAIWGRMCTELVHAPLKSCLGSVLSFAMLNNTLGATHLEFETG